jgi:hypothetical protein
MRYVLGVGFLLLGVAGVGAQNPGQPGGPKEEPSLKQKIQKADLVIVGKVTQTGLSAASSFDVGVIEVGQVLKGDPKTKTANFRFSSTGSGLIAPYGKKGVEGVWVLDKKGAYLEARTVLAFLPLSELKAVKDILADLQPK